MKYNFEELSPEHLSDDLEKRIVLLEKVIGDKTAVLNKAPVGRIRCVKHKNHVEYYLLSKKGDNNGKYLSRANDFLARAIIQRDYNRKILNLLKKEWSVLRQLLKIYNQNSTEHLYETLSNNRRDVITPITLPRESYIQKWLDVEYKHKEISGLHGQYFSIKGLPVRSKSEVIIADTLDYYGIPFRYEFPVIMKNEHDTYIDFHPDFYCLNVRSRKEIIWEHFGMMDDKDYCEKAIHKIKLYEKNGYFTGDKFIFTQETAAHPVTAKELELKTTKYLL